MLVMRIFVLIYFKSVLSVLYNIKQFQCGYSFCHSIP